ncbi:MAG: NADP-dependent oxidoreductase [Opitutales bacterium]|nr:NADP-dependent oxidoreductase [Opitutales bacterium]
MKAIVIHSFGGPEAVVFDEIPVPGPGHGEVRVRIEAAALNPVDWKIRDGYLKDMFPHHFPVTLGWDCAGVVDAVGKGVTGFKEGDAVLAYCRKDFVRDGSLAEFIVLEPRHLAHKPDGLSFESAAALPLAGLTAWQALFDAGKLKKGETVLVHAAAGGVGHFAVQLAKSAGAVVLGTASVPNHDFLRSLGVDHPVDYVGDFVPNARAAAPDGVDLAFDCVGGEALECSPKCLAADGRIVSIVDPGTIEEFAGMGIRAEWVFVAPHAEQLAELAGRAARGDLKVEVSSVRSWKDYAEAFKALEEGHTRGKIVLRID